MTTITFQGNPIQTAGQLPVIGQQAPAFTVTTTDLTDISLSHYQGKKIILNIFPSIDTPVCGQSVRKFNESAAQFKDTVVLCLSADLPFAQQRFCGAENLANVIPLSTFRHPDFGQLYGVTIEGGPLSGLLSRAIAIIDQQDKIIYTEQVAELTHEPNYDLAINAIK